MYPSLHVVWYHLGKVEAYNPLATKNFISSKLKFQAFFQEEVDKQQLHFMNILVVETLVVKVIEIFVGIQIFSGSCALFFDIRMVLCFKSTYPLGSYSCQENGFSGLVQVLIHWPFTSPSLKRFNCKSPNLPLTEHRPFANPLQLAFKTAKSFVVPLINNNRWVYGLQVGTFYMFAICFSIGIVDAPIVWAVAMTFVSVFNISMADEADFLQCTTL